MDWVRIDITTPGSKALGSLCDQVSIMPPYFGVVGDAVTSCTGDTVGLVGDDVAPALVGAADVAGVIDSDDWLHDAISRESAIRKLTIAHNDFFTILPSPFKYDFDRGTVRKKQKGHGSPLRNSIVTDALLGWHFSLSYVIAFPEILPVRGVYSKIWNLSSLCLFLLL